MGLAIYVTKLKPSKEKKDPDNDDFVTPFAYRRFHRSLLKTEKKYSEKVTCDFHFQMSYGWYNVFRDNISQAFLSKKAEQVWAKCSKLEKERKYPNGLYLIINFADNEGFIGPTAVKELNAYFEKCRINGSLKKKKRKFKQLNKDLSPYLNDFIKMVKKAAKGDAYLEFC